MSDVLIYHSGTGAFFGADDDVYMIDIDLLNDDEREEVYEEIEGCGEIPWETVEKIAVPFGRPVRPADPPQS
jgi:hypothetical protein|tara:strand:+ start:3629 stop:3844 length:216 start_codon:yes stop_codon:yes gene_type:complete